MAWHKNEIKTSEWLKNNPVNLLGDKDFANAWCRMLINKSKKECVNLQHLKKKELYKFFTE